MSNIQTTGSRELMSPVHQALPFDMQTSSTDISIPRILLVHSTSDLFKAGKAQAGDLVDAMSATKLGDAANPVSIIPITFKKDYVITKKKGKKFEFDRFEAYTPTTAHYADSSEHWSFVEDGVEHERNFRITWFVLLKLAEGGFSSIPYTISFQRTTLKTGKAMCTYGVTAQRASKSVNPCPWFFTMDIGVKTEISKKTSDSYLVTTATNVVKTEDFDLVNAECTHWINTIASGHAIVDDSDVMEAGTTSPNVGGEDRF